MNFIGIIPAHSKSKRFPEKALYKIKNKSLIQHIYEKTKIKYPSSNIKFANGGDRNNTSTPNLETTYCKKNNIETIWGIGGNNKSNSSSWILKKWMDR